MGIADSSELETELQKIADYILALRREIAVLQANEIHRSRIPAAGDSFDWDSLRFEVMDMDGNRVDKVLVVPAAPPPPPLAQPAAT